MVISKKVIVTVSWKTKQYYQEKGYGKNLKQGDKIEIKIEDLLKNSMIKVKFKCDYCGEEYEQIFCRANYGKKNIQKDSCKKCLYKKREEVSILLYGVEHPQKSKQVREKTEKTNLEKYGVKYVSQNKKIREKQIKTMKERYNVIAPIQNQEIREKTEKTNLEKYGTKYVVDSEIIKEKIKNTSFKKYGVIHPLISDFSKNNCKKVIEEKYKVSNILDVKCFREKVQKTCLEKYGTKTPLENKKILEKTKDTLYERYNVIAPIQNQEIREKTEKTNLEKYGVKYVLSNKEIQNKIRNSLYSNGTAPCSKQQKKIFDLIGGELNYPFYNLSLDIAFPEEKIVVEYNGSGHKLSILYGNISKNDFRKKELKRNYFLYSNGWKVITIISEKDFIYEDDYLKFLIKKAKEYLIEKNEMFVNLDFEKEIFSFKNGKILFSELNFKSS